MLLGALVAALLGAVAEFGLLRRMRRAPALYPLVATLYRRIAEYPTRAVTFSVSVMSTPA